MHPDTYTAINNSNNLTRFAMHSAINKLLITRSEFYDTAATLNESTMIAAN